MNSDNQFRKPSHLSEWLIATRKAKGWSSNQLGERARLSAAAINKIEDGTTLTLREQTRRKLELALGTKVPEPILEEVASELDLAAEPDVPGLGRLENFDPHNAEQRPKAPGIYVLYDISERPVYVGEAANIRVRIRQHEEKFWFKPPIVQTASWIRIADGKLRKQIEQLMIRFLKRNAVINRQHVERAAAADSTEAKQYRPAAEVAASVLKDGPLPLDELFTRMKADGARCKDEHALRALLYLRENRQRFEHLGGKRWQLRGHVRPSNLRTGP